MKTRMESPANHGRLGGNANNPKAVFTVAK
jgi:hypothetical protein